MKTKTPTERLPDLDFVLDQDPADSEIHSYPKYIPYRRSGDRTRPHAGDVARCGYVAPAWIEDRPVDVHPVTCSTCKRLRREAKAA